MHDRDCPLAYEPSGEDFLSPCLAEADLIRRILSGTEFSAWLNGFVPVDSAAMALSWIEARPARRTPPIRKLGHLDGLNLSRAWMLNGIIGRSSSRRPAHRRRSKRPPNEHADAGLAAVTSEHYEGAHWLGTFAVYLLTRRGERS